MARSRKKTPITGVTTAETDKPFKQQEHQRERSRVRDALNADRELDEIDTPPSKLFGNPWASGKDGKHAFDPDKFPKLMRK